MRVLIQRVSRAQCSLNATPSEPVASIGKGMLILAGFEDSDSLVHIEQMTQKIRNLRIFADDSGKMNLSGPEVGAQYLLVSQFTLYGDVKYGNRPSFTRAAEKGRAKEYFEQFVATAERLMGPEQVRSTPFGSDLAVELTNDGPVTLWLASQEIL